MQLGPAQPLMWLLAPHLRIPLHGNYFTSGFFALETAKISAGVELKILCFRETLAPP